MKKINFFIVVIIAVWLLPTHQAFASAQPDQITLDKSKETEQVNSLLTQLYELRSTDKTILTRTERKELRKELRVKKAQLQQEGRRHYGGVYISGTAIIIIILLIILL
jgi:cytochrome c-type biogenesis protein CcmH/NrfG